MDPKSKAQRPNPELNAGLISKLFVLWTMPFLRLGAKKELDLEDVYHSLPEHDSAKLGNAMEEKWTEEIFRAGKNGSQPRLWKVIWRTIWRKIVIIGLGYVVAELGLRTGMLLTLKYFIWTFGPENAGENPSVQWISAGALVTANLAYFTLYRQLTAAAFNLGLKLRLGLSSLIYKKVLCLRKSDVGQLCNLLSSDVGRLDHCFYNLHCLLIAPIQLLVYATLLWITLGPSCLASVGCAIVVIPAQALVGRCIGRFRARIAKASDQRARTLNEVISGVRLLKLYAWEQPFSKLIARLREKEMGFVGRSLYLRAGYLSFHTIFAKSIPFLAFVLYVHLDNRLTADKAFFSMAVFSAIVKSVMGRLTTAFTHRGELLATFNRVETFLMSAESSGTNNGVERTQEVGSEGAKVEMRNYCGGWAEERETLKNLDVKVCGNKLVLVVGHVGCGKSSFLNAILGELPTTSGDNSSLCKVEGGLSYASQEAWIFPATLRQNVLFGLPMDEQRYWETLSACCLEDDLKQWPQADLTLVGERGLVLSGGQKARLSLARALYQKADIYLLDDPLSAVDTKVSRKLFQECIKGRLEGTLRILVTHQLQYLKLADHIIVLNKDGSIWAQGSYDQLENSGVDFSSLISNQCINGKHEGQQEPVAVPVGTAQNAEPAKSGDAQLQRSQEQKNVGSVGVDIITWG